MQKCSFVSMSGHLREHQKQNCHNFQGKCVHGIDCNGYKVAAQSNQTTSFIWGSRNTNHAIFLFLMTKELAQNSEFGDRIGLHVTLAIPLHLCLI